MGQKWMEFKVSQKIKAAKTKERFLKLEVKMDSEERYECEWKREW